MSRIVDPLTRAIFDSDLISTRLTLGLAEAFWALMLLWPGDTFDRPTYSLMGQTAPEWAWMLIFGLTSALQFSIVLRGDFHTPFARIFATWNAGLWCAIVGSMLLSVYPPPAAIGGEAALAVAALWIWARPLLIERGERRYAH